MKVVTAWNEDVFINYFLTLFFWQKVGVSL